MSDVPERIGPYQIIRLLGLGGMAQVYHARKSVEGVDLVVALKVPRQHVVMDPDARQRFLKEAHITTRLGSHPNIVQVLDVGIDGELPYMALEYVTGVDLGRLCEAMILSGTRWSEPAILWVLASIVQALRHAWGAEVAGQPLRIVHRDISPSNVLLTYEGQVKVTDFGISRMAGLDTSGSIRGKARYMPYEQIMGRATAASDLYAVGAIAWELIEGKPFRHDKRTADEMLLATMEGQTPAITRTDVSPRLVQLVTRLLHPQPEQRVQTPMDAWLELKACPGLNLVDPDPLRALIEDLLGQHRQSGYTAVQIRIHPELVATRAALAAAASEPVGPEHVTPVPTLTPTPLPGGPPLHGTSTMPWPPGPSSDARPSQVRTMAAPPVQPRRASSQRSRMLGLAGLGLLLGAGMAVGAMTLLEGPTVTATTHAAVEARPEPAAAPEASAATPAEVQRPHAPTPIAAPELARSAPEPIAAPTPAPEPIAAPEPAQAHAEGGATAAPRPATSAPTKPKPKPVPPAKLHVRLELVPELELRVGSKVRLITGSVTLPAPPSTTKLAVRTPGSTTWYPLSVRLEPAHEYLVRLHAKRIELVPLDRGPR